MTNLSEQIDSNSHNVNISTKDFDVLYEQLDILNAHFISIVCFGEKVFAKMKRNFNTLKNKIIVTKPGINNFSTQFKDLKLNIFQVYHYSSRGKCNQILQEQLKYINDFELNRNNL